MRKREVASKRRRKLKSVLIIIVSLLIVASLIFTAGRSPFIWQERISLVWVTDPVWVTTYHSKTGILGLIRIPSQTYVDVPKGFGRYKIGVLWKLGRIENKQSNILAAAVQRYLAVPIDGWVEIDRQPPSLDGKPEEVFNKLLSSLALHLKDNTSFSTTITFLDRIIIWLIMKKVKPADIVYVDLAKEQVMTKAKLADGSVVEVGSPELIDKISSRLFWEEQMRQSPLVFRVYNGSNIKGYANQVARILTNMGLHVVGITNTSPRNNCQLETPQDKVKDNSVKRIKTLFDCQVIGDSRLKQESLLYLGGEELNRFGL